MKKQSEQQERNLPMLKNSGIKINLVEEHDDDVKLARILMQHKKGGRYFQLLCICLV